MKIKMTLYAISLLAANGATAANIPITIGWEVTGEMTGISIGNSSLNLSASAHAGTTSYSAAASEWPTLSGYWFLWNAGTQGYAAASFTFEQYSTSIINNSLGITAVINQPKQAYSLGHDQPVGGTYDPLTRTLTVGQPLTFPTGGTAGSPISDVSLSEYGSPGSCSGHDALCVYYDRIKQTPGIEAFYMTLTFLSDLEFVGSAVAVDVGGATRFGRSGDIWYSFSFKGINLEPPNGVDWPPAEVPVPGAAWLFGSGALSLVGLVRQRRKNGRGAV